jgi:ABC-type amino acid transport substrate-binding protein
MGTTRWRWMLAAVLAVAALVFAACGGDDEEPSGGGGGAEETATEGAEDVQQFEPNTTLGKIQEKGEIVIGVKYDVPPFGFRNPETNEVEGFDVDLGRAVAESLGVEPKFIEAISDNRIPFLQKGTADLILSTMTINAERVAEINFSDPYFIARGRILTTKDNADIKGVDDLAGKRVCTVLGSTYEATLKQQAPDADLQLVDTYSECFESIQNGSVDAVSTDDVILTGMIIQDDSLQLVGEELTQEPYGAGIKKGDEQLTDHVNGVFSDFKSDGRWQDLYQEWIGQYTKQKAEPPDISVDEAVKLVEQNPA